MAIRWDDSNNLNIKTGQRIKWDDESIQNKPQLKSIFPKVGVEAGGSSPQDIALSTLQGTGKDLAAIPSHFVNQIASNYPRYATEKSGYEYPSETTSPVAGAIAKTSGFVGALKNPLFKMLGLGPESSLVKNIIGGTVAGGAYASDLEDKPSQMAIGAGTPIAIKGVTKLAGRIIPEGIKNKATEGIAYLLRKFPNIGKTLGLSEEGQMARSEKEALSARDEAVKLFPNQTDTLEGIRSTGEQTAKYISPSKNYEEVANQLEIAKGINAGERQKLYDSGILSNSGLQHEPILKLISKAKSAPNANTAQGRRLIKELRDIHTSDIETLNNQSVESLTDPNFYQQRKTFYQNEANQAGSYRLDPSQSVKARAYRALAEGYQNKTYLADDLVKPLNIEESGLIKAHEMAREQAGAEAMELKPDLKGEAISSLSGSPRYTAARFLSKTWMDKFLGSPAKRLSSDISRSMGSSNRASMLANALEKSPESVTLEYPRQLSAPSQKQIPYDRPGNIRRGKYLSPGQSSKPTIYAEGSSTINIPEVLDSTMYALARKYGVPEYSGVRSRQTDIPHTPRAGKTGLERRVRESMKSLAERLRRQK